MRFLGFCGKESFNPRIFCNKCDTETPVRRKVCREEETADLQGKILTMESFASTLQDVGYPTFITTLKHHHQPCVKLNILVSHRVHFAVWGFAPSHFSAQVSDLKGLKLSSHSMEWVMLPAAPSEELPLLMREKEQTMNNSAFLSHAQKSGVVGGHLHEYQHEIEYQVISRIMTPLIMSNWIGVIYLCGYFQIWF